MLLTNLNICIRMYVCLRDVMQPKKRIWKKSLQIEPINKITDLKSFSSILKIVK